MRVRGWGLSVELGREGQEQDCDRHDKVQEFTGPGLFYRQPCPSGAVWSLATEPVLHLSSSEACLAAERLQGDHTPPRANTERAPLGGVY